MTGPRGSLDNATHGADLETVGDGLLRVSEVAKFLGLARSTVYQLMDRGELRYAKILRTRRIPRRAVLDLAVRSLQGKSARDRGAHDA